MPCGTHFDTLAFLDLLQVFLAFLQVFLDVLQVFLDVLQVFLDVLHVDFLYFLALRMAVYRLLLSRAFPQVV